MPYITPEQRNEIDPELETLLGRFYSIDFDAVDGVVNYIVSRVVHEAFRLKREPNYRAVARAIGALECAKLELYRRIASPYEDGKIEQNGDI